MKKFNWIFIFFAIVGFAIISCSDISDQPTTSLNQESSINNPILLEKEVLHFLTGSAHTYNIIYEHPEFGTCIIPGPKENGGFYNVITVNAVKNDDGTVNGHFLSQFQGKIPREQEVGFLGRVKADIIQLIVDEQNHQAKVVCEVTEWNGPLPSWIIMVFVDNGEGNPPVYKDAASSWWYSELESDRDFFLSLSPQEYIDWSWAIIETFNLPNIGPTIPIDNGNIQVH